MGGFGTWARVGAGRIFWPHGPSFRPSSLQPPLARCSWASVLAWRWSRLPGSGLAASRQDTGRWTGTWNVLI